MPWPTYDHRGLALTVTSGLAGGTCTSAANTRTVTNGVDGLGRQFRAEVTAGTGTGDRTQDDTLDSAGNRLTVGSRKAGVTTTTTFSVTKLDATVAEARPDGSTSKTTFDATGNPADKCYWKPGVAVGDCKVVGTPGWSNPPSQSTSSTYDARNQRIQLVDGLTNGITTYDPDHNYQPAAVYLPTSSGRELQTVNAYDVRHRLIGINHQLCVLSSPPTHACSLTTAAGSDSYAYDDNDNRTTVNESNGSASSDRRYCYDALDQLVYRNTGAACSSSAKDEANTYDDAANRLTALVGATTTNFAYTVDGQLCDLETAPTAASCTGGNVTYDTAGRTLTYNGWTFAYDSEGRMLSACKSLSCASGFDKIEFAYDGESHRTQIKTTSAAGAIATRDFRYQSDAIVEERLTDAGHPSGAVVRSYVVDDAGSTVKVEIPAGEPDAGTYLVTWNGHGDALALWCENADGTLTLANSFTYDTWGRPTTAVHSGIGDLGFRLLHGGRFDVQWDDQFDLGLLYMHARHYSPTLGRFLQPDPSAAEGNLYAYAGNEPVGRLDPAGLAWGHASAALQEWCRRDANVGWCFWAELARREAEARMFARWPRLTRGRQNPSWSGGRADAFRHCCWSGFMTTAIGSRLSRYISDDLYELQEPLTDRNTPAMRNMDLHNNAIGRNIGRSTPTIYQKNYFLLWEIGNSPNVEATWDRVELKCLRAGRGRHPALRWLHP